MREQKSVEMFKLVKAQNMLPDKMDELVPLSFIGETAVSYYRAKIKAMGKLQMAEEQRKVTLRDGQDAGEMLLDIEARIGELLPSREEVKEFTKKNLRQNTGADKKPIGKILPEGITHDTARYSRAIAEHPEIVEKIKAQARENDDIPTKTAVLNAIHYEKEKARKQKADKFMGESRALMKLDQVEYINQLERIILILPKEPPREWDDGAFKMSKAYANIIIGRLSVFNEDKDHSTTGAGTAPRQIDAVREKTL